MSIADKLHGKAEEVGGKATGDKKMEMKGKLRQTAENVKDKAEHVKDKIDGKK